MRCQRQMPLRAAMLDAAAGTGIFTGPFSLVQNLVAFASSSTNRAASRFHYGRSGELDTRG